jgi:hypothetical protein
MDGKQSTRRGAAMLGDETYFTGKPCKRGHISERFTSSGHCVECRKADNTERYAKNPQSEKDRKRRAYAADPEKFKARIAKYRAENLERIRMKNNEYMRAWRAANPDAVLEKARASYRNNVTKYIAKDARRRARKMNATPSWDADLTDFVMQEAADLAARRERITGFAWNVDHMVPLQARNACGLHTWANLQVIPEFTNKSKGNRMALTKPGEWIMSS